MRVLVQRVGEARVTVEGRPGRLVGQIGRGFLLLVGFDAEDLADAGAALQPMADKILHLRIMPDDAGHMNRSLLDTGGEILAVSQFTLHADCRRGRRPGFSRAADPDVARGLFDRFVQILGQSGLRVQTGEFGAMMQVALINDGPVTIWLDSEEIVK
jgi:D-aminoacyl-tRNA deacylase